MHATLSRQRCQDDSEYVGNHAQRSHMTTCNADQGHSKTRLRKPYYAFINRPQYHQLLYPSHILRLGYCGFSSAALTLKRPLWPAATKMGPGDRELRSYGPQILRQGEEGSVMAKQVCMDFFKDADLQRKSCSSLLRRWSIVRFRLRPWLL